MPPNALEAGGAPQLRRTPLGRAPPFATLQDMAVTIRRAQSGDVDAIASCLSSLGYEASTELVTNKLALVADSSADAVFVAVDPSVGVVWVTSIHVLPLFHAPGCLARLTALVVLERYR